MRRKGGDAGALLPVAVWVVEPRHAVSFLLQRARPRRQHRPDGRPYHPARKRQGLLHADGEVIAISC